ncbi:ATP-dependent zinc metalloprotease FtsH [compost metagenome]
MKNDIHDLGLVLDSRVRLIVVESWDEQRVLETLGALAVRRGLGLYLWSVTEGVQRLGFGGEPLGEGDSREPEVALRLVKADPQANLYVLCDLHPFLADSPRLVRLLKEVAMAPGNQRPTLVLVSHALKLPAELQRLAARFSLALPGEDELLAIVREEAQRWSERNHGVRVRTDNRTLQQLVKNLRGLAHAEARLLARNVICNDGAITQDDLPELNRARFQLLDMDGVLSFEYETARFAEVGGLANLKRWLDERREAFLAADAGDLPRGVLLVGVQGGGKSLAAKAVAGLWGLPLLRLDFACLYNKYFGETERNLREALKMAEQMAPCVLWMDEIEKGLASGDHDGGVSQRVLGTLLTWMAERKAPVFVVATANAIHRLPPELVRKGRFDELFFVDLPDTGVRAEIFRIHLVRRELEPGQFDLALLAAASAGFSGAEIEQAVVSALYAAQARQCAVDQLLLLQTLQQTAPLSVVMAEELAALRAWAAERTVRAD